MEEEGEADEAEEKEPNIVTNPHSCHFVLQTSKYSPQTASEVAK